MTYEEKEVRELSQWLFKNGFIDIQDKDPEISFLEYNTMRNPWTNRVILCGPSIGGNRYALASTSVTFEEIKEDIEYISEAFFRYCGIEKKEVIKNLENTKLSYWINTVNQWNGGYRIDKYCEFDIEQIKNTVKEDKKNWDKNNSQH